MKKLVSLVLVLCMVMAMAVCAAPKAAAETDVKAIIAEAQNMTLEELAKKAMKRLRFFWRMAKRLAMVIEAMMIQKSPTFQASRRRTAIS